ncbi:hypothetical protein EKH79_14025 [Dyella dinghuensis]|uniref:Uncharacterized protein n=1 Tax=Dyella dinghuensis TaxID=1920169 RepID=A0A3S0RCH8_9GAMM|nr:hypothetical protein [Dyella dinghuensis]RUL62028.1 hypothetical protein EKH79_14025 [Dyella dinghuensis]
MINYERLAILLVRVIATFWLVLITFSWSAYGIELAVGVSVQHYPMHTIIGNVGYIVICLLVLIFSRPLGRLLASGLGEQA